MRLEVYVEIAVGFW